jgi:hypothetical protein
VRSVKISIAVGQEKSMANEIETEKKQAGNPPPVAIGVFSSVNEPIERHPYSAGKYPLKSNREGDKPAGQKKQRRSLPMQIR